MWFRVQASEGVFAGPNTSSRQAKGSASWKEAVGILLLPSHATFISLGCSVFYRALLLLNHAVTLWSQQQTLLADSSFSFGHVRTKRHSGQPLKRSTRFRTDTVAINVSKVYSVVLRLNRHDADLTIPSRQTRLLTAR